MVSGGQFFGRVRNAGAMLTDANGVWLKGFVITLSLVLKLKQIYEVCVKVLCLGGAQFQVEYDWIQNEETGSEHVNR